MGIFDIFSNSDAQNAAATQAQYLGLANTAAANDIATGNQNLSQYYTAALQPFQSQFGVGQQGQTQLGNLLGLNGANGTQQAQQTLAGMPGYQFALNQGTQNTMRNQAQTGALNSGATQNALQAQGQGLASQNYNNYVSQLQPYMNTANTSAQGIGGLYSGLGNQINQNYNTLAGVNYGSLAGIGNAYANADYANLAQSGAIFGGLTSLGGNIAGAIAKSTRNIKPGEHRRIFQLPNSLWVTSYWNSEINKQQVGLIAEEVEKVRPEAVIVIDGIKHVDYRLAVI